MSISIYSILSSLICFNLFILLFYFLRKKLGSLLGYHYLPLLITVILCVFRLLVPVEMPFTFVLNSYYVFPWIQETLLAKVVELRSIHLTIGTLLFCTCSLVSFILLLQLWKTIYREYKILNTIPDAEDNRLTLIFQNIKESAPSKRKCKLLVSQQYKAPFVFSIHHSVIVLPSNILVLSDLDLYFVLKHEWQHHLDRDNQVKIAVEVLCRILWWNPFVYLLRRNLNQTLELKCDRKTTKYLNVSEKIAYMNSLVNVLKLSTKRATETKREVGASINFIGVSISGKDYIDQDVIQRFDNAIAVTETRKWTVAIVSVIIGLVTLFVLSFGFVVQPSSLPPIEELYSDSYGIDNTQIILVTPQNAYLADNTDGTYSLYIDGVFYRVIDKIELETAPYNSLTVKN